MDPPYGLCRRSLQDLVDVLSLAKDVFLIRENALMYQTNMNDERQSIPLLLLRMSLFRLVQNLEPDHMKSMESQQNTTKTPTPKSRNPKTQIPKPTKNLGSLRFGGGGQK